MRTWLLALCLTLTAPAWAQAQTAGSTIDEPTGVYRLDPRHASVQFRILHVGVSWFTARFDVKDATLELNSDNVTLSRLMASADGVNTGVLNGDGERAFDAQIARALGGAPITFASTAIERTGDTTARVTGDLTLNGRTHPATLDVTFVGSTTDLLRGGRRVLGFSAVGVIDRTEWGLRDWGAFTGDDVQIVIEAELVRES